MLLSIQMLYLTGALVRQAITVSLVMISLTSSVCVLRRHSLGRDQNIQALPHVVSSFFPHFSFIFTGTHAPSSKDTPFSSFEAASSSEEQLSASQAVPEAATNTADIAATEAQEAAAAAAAATELPTLVGAFSGLGDDAADDTQAWTMAPHPRPP